MKKVMNIMAVLVISLFSGLLVSKASYGFSLDNPVCSEFEIDSSGLTKTRTCDINLTSTMDGQVSGGEPLLIRINYNESNQYNDFEVIDSTSDLGTVTNTISDSNGGKIDFSLFNTSLENGQTYHLATIRFTTENVEDEYMGFRLSFAHLFDHFSPLGDLYKFGFFDDSIVRYYDDQEIYNLRLSVMDTPHIGEYIEDEEYLQNYPNLKAITGTIVLPAGVEFTGVTSNNVTFNKNTGKFEVDFNGNLEDLLFQIRVNNESVGDDFKVIVKDIVFVTDDSLNEDQTADCFDILFEKVASIYGDWNDDGTFSLVDVVRYRMYIANVEAIVEEYNNFSEHLLRTVDLNCDGELTISDLVSARKLIVGLITLDDLSEQQ